MLRVPPHQRVVQLELRGDLRLGGGDLRVERVLGGAAADADLEGAALLGRCRRRNPRRAGEASLPESLLPQAEATEPNAATAPTAAAPLSRPRRVTRLSLTTS